jgi:hypothetical protein
VLRDALQYADQLLACATLHNLFKGTCRFAAIFVPARPF